MSPRDATIGIDVGGTNVRAALVSADGMIMRRVAEPVEKDRDRFVASLMGLVDALGGEAVAIGVGLPGRVDARAGVVVSAGYLDIAGLDLCGLLGAATGVPVCIENDAGMALIAEMAVGAAIDCRDVAMLTIGTGIGGAIAVDGRLLRGAGFAGQLGHLTVDVQGKICNCGRRGCVETTSSGTALAHHLQRSGLDSTMAPLALRQAAEAGDAAAARALTQWILPLRCAVESLIAAIDPEIVLLGGGLGGAAWQCLDYPPAVVSWFHRPVRAAALGDDAGVIGAALRARQADARAVSRAAMLA